MGIECILTTMINAQGGERSVQHGDGVSETNLRENSMGPVRINERDYNAESEYVCNLLHTPCLHETVLIFENAGIR